MRSERDGGRVWGRDTSRARKKEVGSSEDKNVDSVLGTVERLTEL